MISNHFPVLKIQRCGSLVHWLFIHGSSMVHWFVYKQFWIVHDSSMTFHLVKIIQSKQVFLFNGWETISFQRHFQGYLAIPGRAYFTNHPIFPWKVRRGSPSRISPETDGVKEIFSYHPKKPEGPTYSHRNRLKRVRNTEDMLVTRRVCHWNS